MCSAPERWRAVGNATFDYLQRHPCHRHADMSDADSVVRQETRRHTQQNGETRAEDETEIDGTERRKETRRRAALSDAADGGRRTAQEELRGRGRAVFSHVSE